MKKIYLHIGCGKTGTSSLQSFLFGLGDELLEYDFFYPSTGLHDYAHHLLAELGAQNMSNKSISLYDKLIEEIQSCEANKIIISSESFCFLTATFIEQIKEKLIGFDIKIIFYIREQVSLIESTFLYWQKAGFDDYGGTIENFFKIHKSSFNFMNRINPWVASFGSDAIIARVYEKKIIGKDICFDFANLVGLNASNFKKIERKNVSLRPDFSKLVQLIDCAGISKKDRIIIMSELLRLSSGYRAIPSESLITPCLRNEILLSYKDSNQEFSSQYLDDEQAAYLSFQ